MMSRDGREAVKALAVKTYRDPTASTATRILARAVIWLIDGKPPK